MSFVCGCAPAAIDPNSLGLGKKKVTRHVTISPCFVVHLRRVQTLKDEHTWTVAFPPTEKDSRMLHTFLLYGSRTHLVSPVGPEEPGLTEALCPCAKSLCEHRLLCTSVAAQILGKRRTLMSAIGAPRRARG